MEYPPGAPAAEGCEWEKHSAGNTGLGETHASQSSFPGHGSWLPRVARPLSLCGCYRAARIPALAEHAAVLAGFRSECHLLRPKTTTLDLPAPVGRPSAR